MNGAFFLLRLPSCAALPGNVVLMLPACLNQRYEGPEGTSRQLHEALNLYRVVVYTITMQRSWQQNVKRIPESRRDS